MAMETSTSGDQSSEKNHGRAPKRIHKAEREKMKRGHLNELFLALANSLEPSDQNSGKASVLIDATRVVKDMLAQIECLKKENGAFLSESQYVTIEKNELIEENSALEAEIGELQRQINSKTSELQLDLNKFPPECHTLEPLHNSGTPLVYPPLQHGQTVSPLHLAELCSNMQAYPEVGSELLGSRHVPTVSKPHARYPTPADKWPSQILEKQPDLGEHVRHG